ncbi:hypothetical protein SAMN04490179_3878 [Pseudomonas antarctica]|uniref:Uncharacterized protein n=1 Tax=Pseudomonas antarctica TaxID=219572 RepID=A0A1H0ATL5_9PSED|nr:hypothetical protein PSAN_44240 [Pseudomonas antarctica]SDN36731.1 hypothetical protein SAMN04490179_3878 [Pseudomonas antarctica]
MQKAQCSAGLSLFRERYKPKGFAAMPPFTGFTQLLYEEVHPL